jgi:predicted phage terminase large subunit-like protein
MAEMLTFVDQLLGLDFRAFLLRVFQTVSAGDEFSSNWHQDAIAWALEEVEFGLNRRLIINVPPRSLKTIIASIGWPAWLLGHDPTRRVVCISYSGELAGKLARDCRKVMESAWYRRAFPAARLSKRTAEHDFETLAGGGRFSTSVDGTITGRGGDIIIIDDPMKASDAWSESARKKVIEFFTGTAFSRLNDRNTGSIVLVMQRLHEDDLSGFLLAQGGWKHLCLPARTDEDRILEVGPEESYHWRAGELLDPLREGEAVLAEAERNAGSAAFSAQWLQQPIPATGILVKREWLRFYEHPPQRQYGDQIVQAWDTANKNGVLNDFSCCVTALVRKNTVYVLDVFCGKLDFPSLKDRAVQLARDWNASVLLIEDAASGAQLIQSLRVEQPTGVPTPVARPATSDKVTRFAAQTPKIQAGDLILPKEAPWLASFLHEILGFPHARHDDQADALAHLLEWLGSRGPSEPPLAGPMIYDGETDEWSGDLPPGWNDPIDDDFDPWAGS